MLSFSVLDFTLVCLLQNWRVFWKRCLLFALSGLQNGCAVSRYCFLNYRFTAVGRNVFQSVSAFFPPLTNPIDFRVQLLSLLPMEIAALCCSKDVQYTWMPLWASLVPEIIFMHLETGNLCSGPFLVPVWIINKDFNVKWCPGMYLIWLMKL